MNLKLKRIDWYIIKQFLGTYVFAILLIISISVVFDINEKIDKLYEKMGDIPPSEPQKGTTMDEYLNGEKGEKENQFEGYEIDKFKQNNSSDNPPDEELNYTDENGNHLNLRSGNYPENNEKPVSDNIKDIEEEINLIMDANTVKENSSANPQPAENN